MLTKEPIGKWRRPVTLLHFMTGGCVNCLHVLKEIESFGGALPVISIHTGKFDREKETPFVEMAAKRYGIDHPIVNDADGSLWDAFAIKAWPTLVLVDERGYEIARASGEGRVAALLEKAQITIMSRRPKTGRRSGFDKVLWSEQGLWLSHPGSGEVLLVDDRGGVLRRFEGFEEPRGLCEWQGGVAVCDRAAGRVVWLDPVGNERRTLAEGLRSPWGIEAHDRRLYCAEAGTHRILCMKEGVAYPVAGRGFEGIRDGKALDEALFAQPTDLAWLGEALYVADAEGSAIRVVAEERVETPVGWDLFTFGDRDGIGEAVRLQHPEGLCAGVGGCGNHRIFIADTYNDKVKAFDPLTGRTMTLVDELSMPTGVAKEGCRLAIVDSVESSLVLFDLTTFEKERITII